MRLAMTLAILALAFLNMASALKADLSTLTESTTLTIFSCAQTASNCIGSQGSVTIMDTITTTECETTISAIAPTSEVPTTPTTVPETYTPLSVTSSELIANSSSVPNTVIESIQSSSSASTFLTESTSIQINPTTTFNTPIQPSATSPKSTSASAAANLVAPAAGLGVLAFGVLWFG